MTIRVHDGRNKEDQLGISLSIFQKVYSMSHSRTKASNRVSFGGGPHTLLETVVRRSKFEFQALPHSSSGGTNGRIMIDGKTPQERHKRNRNGNQQHPTYLDF